MTHETAKDYLGHSCKFTEAKTHFSEPLHGARQLEYRQLKRQVGILLLDLAVRVDHAINASSAIRDVAISVDDDGQMLALMEMFSVYEIETSNIFFEFAGLVLAGFEDTTGAAK
jgi:hypothetical protein